MISFTPSLRHRISAVPLHVIACAIIVLLAGLLPGAAGRAQDFWRQTNGPEGGPVIDLATTSDGTIFAATEGAGLFRSTDEGKSWIPASDGLPQPMLKGVEIHPDGTFLVVTVDSGIVRSTDGGTTWHPANSGLKNANDRFIYGLTVSADGTFYLGTHGGAFLSTDRGSSWERAGGIVGTRETYWFSTNSLGHVFTYGLHEQPGTPGILRSTDRGSSWQPLDFDIQDYDPLRIVVGPHDRLFLITQDSGLFTSTNHGESWLRISGGLPGWQIAAVHSNGAGTLLASTTSYLLYRSTDDGATWSVPDSATMSSYVTRLVTTRSGAILGADAYRGIWRSTDMGASWAFSHRKLVASSVINMAIDRNGIIYANTSHQGVQRSTDNGATWVKISPRQWNRDAFIRAVTVDTAGTVYLAAIFSIYRSEDSGRTWKEFPVSFLPRFLAFDNRNRLLGGGDNDANISTNRGESWSRIHNSEGGIEAMVVDDDGTIFSGGFDGFFRNGSRVPDVGRVRSLAISPQGDLYVGTTYGLRISTDGGKTFSPQGFYSSIIHDIAFAPDGRAYIVVDREGVFRQTVNDTTWEKVESGLNWKFVYQIELAPDGHLLVGTGSQGIFRSSNALPAAVPLPRSPSFPAAIECLPNPVGSEAIIRYILEKPSRVTISITDLLGREIARPVDEEHREAGSYSLPLNARGIPDGTYFCVISTEQGKESRRMVVMH